MKFMESFPETVEIDGVDYRIDSDFRTSEGDGYSYPMLRTVTLGVNLSF